jgi:uncharacterized membrane protein YqgA involved in biofilm formation
MVLDGDYGKLSLMVGTIINTLAILAGGGVGVLLGDRLPQRVQSTLMAGLGLFTLLMGVKNFFDSQNILIVLGALITGGLLWELLKIEEGLINLGGWLRKKFEPKNELGVESRFIEGFVVASLLFCIGPMAILGSIQNGLSGDFTTLLIKSVLDAIAAMAFATTLGVGVLFSAAIVLVYQGTITLFAQQFQQFTTTAMIAEMNGVGGILLAGIGISSLLAITKIRISSYLPALFIAPLIVWVLGLLQIAY